MPTPTPATPPCRQRPPVRLAALSAGAAAFAAGEIAAAVLIGRLFDWGRAEALLFFAFRPWLLVAAALAVARRDLRWRAGVYAASLAAASASEALLLAGLGAPDPLPEIGIGLLAGAALAVMIDAAVQLGKKLRGCAGAAAAAALAAALLLVPGALSPYERLVLGPAERASNAPKPPLMLMTELPIVWGEGGAFDPASRPAAGYRALQEEFDIRLIDHLDGAKLRGRLLLLAQPRALDPAELVALDAWVRGGGRVLVLTDPALLWPSGLPLGDIRRPPATGMLGPLLGHWGLAIEPEPAPEVRRVDGVGADGRRLVLAAPGRFAATGTACSANGPLAQCRIGAGTAHLVADADLLHDALWAGPDGSGARHVRTADNPLLVADWLDALAGIQRERVRRPVVWATRGSGARTRALLLAALPGLTLLAWVGVARLRRRL